MYYMLTYQNKIKFGLETHPKQSNNNYNKSFPCRISLPATFTLSLIEVGIATEGDIRVDLPSPDFYITFNTVFKEGTMTPTGQKDVLLYTTSSSNFFSNAKFFS